MPDIFDRSIFPAASLENGVALRLRAINVDDAERMYAWMRDPVIRNNVGLRSEPSLKATLAWIGRAETDQGMAAWAIEIGGRHVGNVILDQLDQLVRSVRLSVYIGDSDFRGRGVGGRAIDLALRDAFEQRALAKVWLSVVIDNVSAIRCYHRCGFRIEGIHRQDFYADGAIKDSLYMGVTRSDFAAVHSR